MSVTANQYLKKILEQETFSNDDDELEELRGHSRQIHGPIQLAQQGR